MIFCFQLASVDVVAAIEMYVEQGEWDRALATAEQHVSKYDLFCNDRGHCNSPGHGDFFLINNQGYEWVVGGMLTVHSIGLTIWTLCKNRDWMQNAYLTRESAVL